MTVLNEYVSEDNSGYKRRATISTPTNEYDGAYIVDMFEGDFLVDSRMIEGRTYRYADECAENWVLGVIK